MSLIVGLLENLRSGSALACGLRVELDAFRTGLDQLAALFAGVAALVAGLRFLTADATPIDRMAGPGPTILLIVGAAGSVLLVNTIRRARLSLFSLLVVILSAEAAVLTIGGVAWLLISRFPSTDAGLALGLLPWLMLAWMTFIVLRATAVVASAPRRRR
jgi:hypothetical protein